MAKKRELKVVYELDLVDKKVTQLINYIDSVQLDQLQDRVEITENERTGATTIKVIATKEAQVKSLTEVLKLMPDILSTLDELRHKHDEEVQVVETRGDVKRSLLMQHAHKAGDSNDS